MKLVREMTADELMQMIGAVSLRISALIYAISATRELFYLVHHIDSIQTAVAHRQTLDSYTSQYYAIAIGFDLLIAVVLFSLSVQLSRFLCRGLLEALSLTGAIKPSASQS